MRQLNYRRTELKLSDHRPVTATYMAEVEVFSPRKLQRALTFTDAEIENEDVVTDMGIDVGSSCLTFEQVSTLVALEIGKDASLSFSLSFFKSLFMKNYKIVALYCSLRLGGIMHVYNRFGPCVLEMIVTFCF